MDKFLVFSLSLEDQAFINKYRAPARENSVLKFVPLDQIDRARTILKKVGIRSSTKYRGPRRYPDYTLKSDALYASFYRR